MISIVSSANVDGLYREAFLNCHRMKNFISDGLESFFTRISFFACVPFNPESLRNIFTCSKYSIYQNGGDFIFHHSSHNCYISTNTDFSKVNIFAKLFDENIIFELLLVVFRYRALYCDCLVIHSAVVSYKENAIAFIGNKGAGKSTQAKLWQQYLSAQVINYDKPIVFLNSKDTHICGTPWSGKEPCYKNESCSLRCAVKVVKSQNNMVKELQIPDKISMMYLGNYIFPLTKFIEKKYFSLVSKLANEIEMYEAHCTKSEADVIDLYKTLYSQVYERRVGIHMVKVKDGYIIRSIADDWIVIPRGSEALNFNATIVLNDTGVYLWNALKNWVSIEDLTLLFTKEYCVDRDVAKFDIEKFIQKLSEENIIEEC